MKIKNLYSFFTKLQTRIMNKTNIYHSQETKTKKDKERKNHYKTINSEGLINLLLFHEFSPWSFTVHAIQSPNNEKTLEYVCAF